MDCHVVMIWRISGLDVAHQVLLLLAQLLRLCVLFKQTVSIMTSSTYVTAYVSRIVLFASGKSHSECYFSGC
jgi:hypothetical protein